MAQLIVPSPTASSTEVIWTGNVVKAKVHHVRRAHASQAQSGRAVTTLLRLETDNNGLNNSVRVRRVPQHGSMTTN